jgi:arylsulfatase
MMYGNNQDPVQTGQEPYDTAHVVLPEIMKDNGYTTGMFGKWAGGYEGSISTPATRGVDEYYGFMCQFQAHLYYPNFLNAYSRAAGDTIVRREVLEGNINHAMYGTEYKNRQDYSAELIHRRAMEWLEQQTSDRPFFGIFTYTLPHAELAQPEDSIFKMYQGVFGVEKSYGGDAASRYNPTDVAHQQFAAMVTRLDMYVGEVLSLLRRKGLAENTLVIFTSDNGPVISDGYEDGAREACASHQPAHPWRGGKYSLFEGGTRVPFIVSWPGSITPGASPALISQMDLPRTLATLCGIQTPDNCLKDSENLLPALLGLSKAGRNYLVTQAFEGPRYALRSGQYKYIPDYGRGRADRQGKGEQLYDLNTDPGEQQNLAPQQPEKTAELRKRLQELTAGDIYP